MEKIKLCKCGCKQPIVIKPHHKWYGIPDYIIGHRQKHALKKLESIKKYCKCGCGQLIKIKLYYKYSSIPDYVKGHRIRDKNYKNYKSLYKYCQICKKELSTKQKIKGCKFCSLSCWYKTKKGTPNTKKHNENISKAQKGIKHSEESKQKIKIRNIEKWKKLKDLIKLCKCGCGNKIIIKYRHIWHRIPDYIAGHHLMGTKHTKEHRKKQSISALKYIEENDYTKEWTNIGIIEPIFEETVLKKISNLKYEAQKRINRIGIVDFFLPDYGIIIECDEKHHKRPEQKSKDADRDLAAMFIYKYKYITIRFTDTEIENDPKNCIKEIKKCIRKKGVILAYA